MTVQNSANPVIASESQSTTVTKTLPSIDAKIDHLAGLDQDFRATYVQLLTLLGESLDALWGLLEIVVGGRTVSHEYSSLDQLQSDALLEMAYSLSTEAQMDSVSRAKLIPGQTGNYAAFSAPIMDLKTRTVAGTVTFFLAIDSKQDAGSKLNYIETALARFVQLANSRTTSAAANSVSVSTPAEPPAELAALLKATQCEDLRGLCFSLVNGYCQKFGCSKTAIGIVENNRTKVYAISGMDQLMENCPAVIDIQQSQDECLDFDRRIVVQESDRADLPASDGFLIHQKWHQSTAAAAVASVPIRVDGKTIAVFSLERSVDQPFEEEELNQVENSIQTFGPAINLMQRSGLSLRKIAKEKAKNFLLRPFKSKLSTACILGALTFFALGWLPYRPTIPCNIQPGNVSHVVAPFDGVLASAPLFAGDEIVEGQTLLKFDTRKLELDRKSVQSRIRARQISRNVAISERKKTEAAILEAEIEALRVEEQIAHRNIELASVQSRLNGTIIRGDLREKLGQFVAKGTPLMEVSPAGSMKIQIQIPESKAGLIKPGYEGVFAAGSNPADKQKFRITRITPSTELVDGKNVVMAEAEIEGQSDWMRSGMSGYAKVKAGWQPVWWILGHGIVDGLRLRFWL